jgi:HEPN domain-containing protein
MTRDEIMRYWVDSSEVDFKAMENLFNNGHYVWALFIGHLVIEKLLKAYHVKNVDVSVPPIHDLTKIAEKADLTLSENQKDFLDEVTTFNIKARYPDYKNRFFRKATKEFTEIYITKIGGFRQWLIEKIKK